MSTDETPPEGGRDFRAALKARWDTARDAVEDAGDRRVDAR
mgnify:CR=1 FL=1